MSRTTKLGPGGNTIVNGGNYSFNKYSSNRGVCSTSISNFYALKRSATFCKKDCANLQAISSFSPLENMCRTRNTKNVKNRSVPTYPYSINTCKKTL